MLVPELRFRRDDGTDYPTPAMKKLGEITEPVNRKAPADSSAPVMMISQGNGFIYQADKYSRENAGQSLKRYTLLLRGEMAYNHGASKAKPYGVAYLLKEEDEARVPFVYHTFRIVDGDPKYWHLALNTSEMDRKLKQLVSSGVRMDGLLNISYDAYTGVSVVCPCLEEQQKIAAFLSDLDEVISASEAEVAGLELQKKGIMQKIFSQEVRFKRDDGTEYPEWENRNFGELYKQITEKNDGSFKTDKIISVANMYFKSSATVGNDEYLKTYNVCRLGDIAFEGNRSKNFAYGRFVENIIGDGIVSHVFVTLRPINKMHNLLYWKYVINYEPVMGRILVKCTKKSTMMTDLVVKDFLKQVISVPCLEEQQKIASFLSDIDKAIDLAKQELEQWKLLKKGLMQRMFV